MPGPTASCSNTVASASQRIREYTGDEQATFDRSRMMQVAVVRNLQTLAESTQPLSEPLRNTEPGVPWRAIAGIRNVLTHGYHDFDLEAVWSVIEQELPDLTSAVERVMRARRPLE